MGGIGTALANLARLREQWEASSAAQRPQPGGMAGAPHRSYGSSIALERVDAFGSNPGALEMYTYRPARLAPSPALVVVLHGCTQTAASYNDGSGWSALADRCGFVLLFPQQVAANNPKTCFNWFLPDDIARDSGEALSIQQMVERAAGDHGVDPARVFVTGLSAGGAMAAVMLATYPEVFAGGAVIAGLPYGGARNVQQALESMFKGRSLPGPEWGDRVRSASRHRGPWPTLSVWHGGSDGVVVPSNADELVRQWTDLHGVPADPSAAETVDGHPRAIWRDASGREVIESFKISGMAHGAPLAVGEGYAQGGAAGPFMLDVGISSSYHIAKFWGLADEVAANATDVVAIVSPAGVVAMPRAADAPGSAGSGSSAGRPAPKPRAGAIDVGDVIRKALESAGLSRR